MLGRISAGRAAASASSGPRARATGAAGNRVFARERGQTNDRAEPADRRAHARRHIGGRRRAISEATTALGQGRRGPALVGHEHAYILPLAREREGRDIIDRVLIWARGGFEPDAWQVLQRLASSGRRLRGAEGHPLALILAGYGDHGELNKLLGREWLEPTRTWISATPFIPPRFTKLRRGEVLDSPEDQLRRLLREVLGQENVKIEGDKRSAFFWNDFVRARKKGRNRPPGRRGFGFRLTFAEPVRGPIALGYGAHFGLGLFKPEPSSTR
ncbi:MAG: type I-U CRISPR-associated protein Cas5/Cas6 [Deltaproteobacteria bacterium]|nr:type I-U CRISPR-associated protein Cas5/Cas6 [Deltaproteobacteria bacterium]